MVKMYIWRYLEDLEIKGILTLLQTIAYIPYGKPCIWSEKVDVCFVIKIYQVCVTSVSIFSTISGNETAILASSDPCLF